MAEKTTDLSPKALAEVQRILDAAARRMLDERIEAERQERGER